MKHYRLYKLKDNRIVKGKDIEALSDSAAIEAARNDADCPTCEVWQGTKQIGIIK